MDGLIRGYINGFAQINSGVLPIFVTDSVYTTRPGFLDGGYHSSLGKEPSGQTYIYGSYLIENDPNNLVFGQDVSILSHELGEWMDDPFTDNKNVCGDGGLLEVGDPLESETNYGTFVVTLQNRLYHIQDLVFCRTSERPARTRSISCLISSGPQTRRSALFTPSRVEPMAATLLPD